MTAITPTDDRPRVVTDIRTGETVYGPAARAEVGHWIINDGFWRGADLRVDVVAEPPAVAYDKPACEIMDSLYTCTRPPGHEGDHAAHGADDVIPVHSWPQDGAR